MGDHGKCIYIFFFAEVIALIAKNTAFEGSVGRSLSRLKRRFLHFFFKTLKNLALYILERFRVNP